MVQHLVDEFESCTEASDSEDDSLLIKSAKELLNKD